MNPDRKTFVLSETHASTGVELSERSESSRKRMFKTHKALIGEQEKGRLTSFTAGEEVSQEAEMLFTASEHHLSLDRGLLLLPSALPHFSN